jgi:hypothetical protein
MLRLGKKPEKFNIDNFDDYLKEENQIKLSRMEIYLIVIGLSHITILEDAGLDDRIKITSLAKKLIEYLKIDGILPLDEDLILEWSKNGFC